MSIIEPIHFTAFINLIEFIFQAWAVWLTRWKLLWCTIKAQYRHGGLEQSCRDNEWYHVKYFNKYTRIHKIFRNHSSSWITEVTTYTQWNIKTIFIFFCAYDFRTTKYFQQNVYKWQLFIMELINMQMALYRGWEYILNISIQICRINGMSLMTSHLNISV